MTKEESFAPINSSHKNQTCFTTIIIIIIVIINTDLQYLITDFNPSPECQTVLVNSRHKYSAVTPRLDLYTQGLYTLLYTDATRFTDLRPDQREDHVRLHENTNHITSASIFFPNVRYTFGQLFPMKLRYKSDHRNYTLNSYIVVAFI